MQKRANLTSEAASDELYASTEIGLEPLNKDEQKIYENILFYT
jgi:hypothetical protein